MLSNSMQPPEKRAFFRAKRSAVLMAIFAVAAAVFCLFVVTAGAKVHAAETDQPSWVATEPDTDQNGTLFVTLSLGPYASEEGCRAKVDAAIEEAAADYIDEYLYDGDPPSRPIRFTLAELQDTLLTDQRWLQAHDLPISGRMHTLHLRLRFDNDFREMLDVRQENADSQQRAGYFGLGMVLIVVLLGTVVGYVRLDTKTKGFYTGRLQLAASVVILSVIIIAEMMRRGLIVERLLGGDGICY